MLISIQALKKEGSTTIPGEGVGFKWNRSAEQPERLMI